MHIRSTGGTPQNALMDISHVTLCGQDLTTGLFTRERSWNKDGVCKKCIVSVRHFPPDWIEETES